MESVGFSPDRNPEIIRRGVVGFVVFKTVEQRNAALVDQKVCYALMNTEFQLGPTGQGSREDCGPGQAGSRTGGCSQEAEEGGEGAAQATGQGHRSRWQHRLAG